jgi:hypothetical protein
MKRETALKLNVVLLDIIKTLDESAHLAQGQLDGDEFTIYRRCIGTVMTSIMFDVLKEVHNEFPDLKPKGYG